MSFEFGIGTRCVEQFMELALVNGQAKLLIHDDDFAVALWSALGEYLSYRQECEILRWLVAEAKWKRDRLYNAAFAELIEREFSDGVSDE